MRPFPVSMFLGVAICLTAAPAQADPGKAYVRISAGATVADDLGQHLSYSPFIISIEIPPNHQSISTEIGYDLGAAIGWRLTGSLSGELEYRSLSSEIDTIAYSGGFTPFPGANQNPVLPSEESLDAQLLMANLRLDLPSADNLTPFLGVGLGGAEVKSVFGETDQGVAGQLIAGLKLAYGENRSFVIEIDHLRTEELAFGPDAFTPAGPFGLRATDDAYVVTTLRLGFQQEF